MKRTFLVGLFVFSLALNLAVAATLGWHLWKDFRLPGTSTAGLPISDVDMQQIRARWMASGPGGMMDTRRMVMDKQLELLDQIARHPGRPEAAEQNLKELIALKAQMEKQAVVKISNTLAELPLDKREPFMALLKTRACMGPGMGMRHRGRAGMGPCPVRGTISD